MAIYNTRNAILTHENPIIDTKIVILCITVQKFEPKICFGCCRCRPSWISKLQKCQAGVSITPSWFLNYMAYRLQKYKERIVTRQNKVLKKYWIVPPDYQAAGPVRLDTAVHLWFGQIIRRTPRVHRAMSVRASYWPHTGIYNVFNILRDPCGTRKGAVRDPQGCRTTPLRAGKGTDITRIGKNPAQATNVAVRGPYRTSTGCSQADYNL